MKKPTELCTLLKAFFILVIACLCLTALAVGSFGAKNNSEYVFNGTKTDVVNAQSLFGFK